MLLSSCLSSRPGRRGSKNARALEARSRLLPGPRAAPDVQPTPLALRPGSARCNASVSADALQNKSAAAGKKNAKRHARAVDAKVFDCAFTAGGEKVKARQFQRALVSKDLPGLAPFEFQGRQKIPSRRDGGADLRARR